jgi:hypothetical protein
MKIYRKWDRLPSKTAPAKNYNQRAGVAIHHSVTSMKEDSVEAEAQHMRYLQNLAFQRGFSDISYNHVLFPASGRVWKGRGFETVGAHDDGSNTDYLGLVVVGNYETDKVTLTIATSIIDYIRFAEDAEHLPEHPVVYGHRDHDPTACPGANLYERIPDIRKAVGGRRP